MIDFDAGRKSAEQDASGATLQNIEQVRMVAKFIDFGMHGRGELAVHLCGKCGELRGGFRAHEHSARAEIFLGEFGMCEQACSIGFEQGCATLAAAAITLREHMCARILREGFYAVAIGVGDARRQHGRGIAFAEQQFQSCTQALISGAVGGQYQTWRGAKLAARQHHRNMQTLGDRFGARRECCGQNENRIDRAHFRVHRNRLLALRREREQRPPAALRARETHRLNDGVHDQRRADVMLRVEQQRKNSSRQTAFTNSRLDGQTDNFRSAGMRRMCFDDYRATRGKCGGGVTARDRKREWEIARAEHRDRAERAPHRTQVGFWRAACRIAMIDTDIQPIAIAQYAREQTQLHAGTCGFVAYARLGQAGFARYHFDQ